MSNVFGGLMGKVAAYSMAAGVGVWCVQKSLFDVSPGERAIIYDHIRGIKDKVYGEGTHFLVPYLQYPIHMDVRTRARTISTVTGTKDLQQVNLSLRILSRPRQEKCKIIFQKLGLDYDERILPSIGNEVMKAVVAQYNADQLLTLRDQVSQEIRQSLVERAEAFNIILDDIAITHLGFSRDFSASIEQKQVAQQHAERAKFVVQKAEQEKKALIIQSEGDAEAARLVSDAIAQYGQGLIEIRRIETAHSVANTLARSRNITYLPSQGNLLLNIGAAR